MTFTVHCRTLTNEERSRYGVPPNAYAYIAIANAGRDEWRVPFHSVYPRSAPTEAIRSNVKLMARSALTSLRDEIENHVAQFGVRR